MTNNDLSAIIAQGNTNSFKKADQKFSKEELLQKFFTPRVPKGQKSGMFKFRIVPNATGGSPFNEIKFHYMQVNGQWQKLLCLEELGEECPLCETHSGLLSLNDKDNAKRYRPSKFYIVRGIERGKEHEGVKFWRFKQNFKAQGEFDKILAKINIGFDILDPKTGFDLVISCGLDDRGNSIVQDISCVMASPLAPTQEAIDLLVNDDATWKDVFRPKTKEHLEDVVAGKAQYWNQELKKYVRPGEENGVAEETIDVNFDSSIVETSLDAPVTATPEVKVKPIEKKVAPVAKEVKIDIEDAVIDEDDDDFDLPF